MGGKSLLQAETTCLQDLCLWDLQSLLKLANASGEQVIKPKLQNYLSLILNRGRFGVLVVFFLIEGINIR